jgi:hypothetical protein
MDDLEEKRRDWKLKYVASDLALCGELSLEEAMDL